MTNYTLAGYLFIFAGCLQIGDGTRHRRLLPFVGGALCILVGIWAICGGPS